MSDCITCSDLHISFKTHNSEVLKAVQGVSFSLENKKTLGIVGESGCGKSLTVLSILQLIPQPDGFIEKGEIVFDNTNLLSLSEKKMQAIRGGKISMIFQDPMTSLNPVFTCGMQIRECVEQHITTSSSDALDMTYSILNEVGISDSKRIASSYPHQLSGGLRQRVMIAMALVCSPQLLIADEPTTALDVTVQARILDLLHELQQHKHMSMILITHNLGIVGDICHTVMVMYSGMVMEYASVGDLFDNPLHPYTQSLLETIPYVDRVQKRLTVIPGDVPTLSTIPSGCPYHPRCNRKMTRCTLEKPSIIAVNKHRQVRCFLYE